jgi:hypothetical protein
LAFDKIIYATTPESESVECMLSVRLNQQRANSAVWMGFGIDRYSGSPKRKTDGRGYGGATIVFILAGLELLPYRAEDYSVFQPSPC